MKKTNDPSMIYLVAILLLIVLIYSLTCFSQEVRTVHLSSTSVARIPVSTMGTTLSFPARPGKVILGRSGSFAIEYVEDDLAITPLSLRAVSNLFVYVFGRRYSFNLIASSSSPTSLILVRDTVPITPLNKSRRRLTRRRRSEQRRRLTLRGHSRVTRHHGTASALNSAVPQKGKK